MPLRSSEAGLSRLWIDLFVLGFSTATGFVAAGIVSSFYQLVTAEPAKFRLLGASVAAWVLSFLFFGVTGPFIIMRNAVHARRVERQAVGWLFGSLLIASLWSVCSGVVVLHLALTACYGWG